MKPIKKLYLIDGMSVVFRAYHAMQKSGLKNSKGEPTFALLAFVNIITTLLENENPDHIAVAFDRPEPTFRHLMYAEYKANRAAFPEDLAPQLPKIKKFLDLISIPRIEKSGFEADDIIGTLTKSASEKKIDVACITNDKDYYQLVNEHVRLYKPNPKGEDDFQVVDVPEVFEKFGVKPSAVIDVLALIGDSSDNIPGVKGIGDKTAIPLIQKYGSVENLYQHVDEIPSASVKDKLIKGKDSCEQAKLLVTIKTDVPLDVDVDQLELGVPKFSELDSFFADAGFHTIRKRWAEKGLKSGMNVLEDVAERVQEITETEVSDSAETTSNSNTVDHEYIHVWNEELLDSMLEEISRTKVLSVDLETSSLDRLSCEIVGIALCAKENRAFYVSVFSDIEGTSGGNRKSEPYSIDSLFGDVEITGMEQNSNVPYIEMRMPLSTVLARLKPVLENQGIEKIGQNIKFDSFILSRFEIYLAPITFDTMLASYLLDPDQQHNLDVLSQKWLNYTPIPISSLIGAKKSEQKSMKDIDPVLIAEYAGEDADLALKLYHKLKPELSKENLIKLGEEIEFPLIEVLTRMELNGIAIDTAMLSEMSVLIDGQAKTLKQNIYHEAGTEFNIDSPKQLGEILFDKLQIPPLSKTKTGYSTNVTVLSQLAPIYPIAAYMLDYRQLQKLKSTYVDSLPRMIDSKTGRIHTTYNQTIASTGRLSSTDPNLQNIPIRTDLGKEIRKAFVPGKPDTVLLSADYSQIELRIMAHISEDAKLIDSFRDGLDIHSATASILFDKPISEVNSDNRRVAKTVNFGIMYGLGAFGLAQRLGISRTEGKEIIGNYFSKYPGIRKYIDMTIRSAEESGYAVTLCGRRRYFQNINSKNNNLKTIDERAAINHPIQGTAADMLKIAMLRIDKELRLRGLKSQMLLQVHDELVFEAYNNELEELISLVKSEMEAALPLGDVPVIAETGYGSNWLDAH
jgi:DNA polymerase-1